MVAMLFIQGCAHQSKVKPSNGHIDGQNQPQKNKASENQTALNTAIPKPVKNIPYLPPPQAKTKPQTYSVVVNEVRVKEILFALARESKLNIDIDPSIQGVVTLNAVDQTLPAILDRLARQVDMTYKMEGTTLTIRPDAPFLKTYAVNYVNMNRDTKSEVGVSNEIASSASVNGEVAGGSGNTSTTKVSSDSQNHYLDTLIQNIKDILIESDKEVLIGKIASKELSRDDFNTTSTTQSKANNGDWDARADLKRNANIEAMLGEKAGSKYFTNAAPQGSLEKEKETTTKDYKTLFAASVIANKETGILSVRASQRQHEKIQEFLDKVQASGKRQVLIEASIVEIKLNDRYQSGVDWSRLGSAGSSSGFTFSQGRGASGSVTSGVTDSASGVAGTGAGLIVGYFNPAGELGNIAASVKLLQQFGTTKVLSSPKLMVLNSQTAILKAVDNLVYFTTTSTPAIISNGVISSPAIFTTTPHTIPVGIWMSVTPQVNENGVVTMNVRPTISRKSGDTADPNPNLKIISNIPQITVREMESILQVPSGNTVILGGLMQDEITNTSNGVPGISKVPGIGNAFKSRDENSAKTELVIFLRPTVIPYASLESEELQSYKQYLPSRQLQNALDESSN